jgi:hypothetical protein
VQGFARLIGPHAFGLAMITIGLSANWRTCGHLAAGDARAKGSRIGKFARMY